MDDLNTVLRQQAQAGLQVQLDRAVEAGDTEVARRVSDQIAQLAVQTAPKTHAFSEQDIRASLESKATWFGVDPKKSSKAVEFGKTMDPKRFGTAEAFADALIKAVDEEFKPAAAVTETPAGDENEDDDENEDGNKPPPKPRRSDGPNENEGGVRATGRKSSGPWLKLSDAPKEIQAEIKRQADKFAPKTKEGRETFQTKALEVHYRLHQQKQEKK